MNTQQAFYSNSTISVFMDFLINWFTQILKIENSFETKLRAENIKFYSNNLNICTKKSNEE